jgi:Ca2+-binding RTX toxin-like protein
MVSTIPDGGSANERITLGYGVWKGSLDGNDTLFASQSYVTVNGGSGKDSIHAENATLSILLGNGKDTLNLETGDHATVSAGSGRDTLSLDRGTFVVHLGNGNDTIRAFESTATITAGKGNDSVRVHTGDYSVHLGSGNDTVDIEPGAATVVAGDGRDNIHMRDGRFSLHLGNGHDTAEVSGADATIGVGHGRDSLDLGEGRFAVHAGGGFDTVGVERSEAAIQLAGSHDKIALNFGGAYTLLTGGSHDTIEGGTRQSWSIQGHGFDSVSGIEGTGKLQFDQGHDTITLDGFSGLVTANGGHDKIVLSDVSAILNANAGSDTIVVGGAVTLNAGHNDLIKFVDQSGAFTGSHAHAMKTVIANTTGGRDTFEYQYSDDPPDTGAANAKGIGKAVIVDFNRATDVLRFHDRSDGDLTQGAVNAHATVVDHVGANSITIIVQTTLHAAAGTIVLKGIGTLHHHLASINDLVAHGYHLQFG